MFLTHSRTSVDRELSDLSNKRFKKNNNKKRHGGYHLQKCKVVNQMVEILSDERVCSVFPYNGKVSVLYLMYSVRPQIR